MSMQGSYILSLSLILTINDSEKLQLRSSQVAYVLKINLFLKVAFRVKEFSVISGGQHAAECVGLGLLSQKLYINLHKTGNNPFQA